MADLRFEKEITALLVIDPYNDFISEGGKLWDRIKGVAEANDCVRHMLQVLTAAREAGLRVFYAMHHRYRPGDYETWKHVAPVQKAAWSRKTFEHGTWGGECRAEFTPQPGEIVAQEHWCSSGFANTDLDLQLKRHGIQPGSAIRAAPALLFPRGAHPRAAPPSARPSYPDGPCGAARGSRRPRAYGSRSATSVRAGPRRCGPACPVRPRAPPSGRSLRRRGSQATGYWAGSDGSGFPRVRQNRGPVAVVAGHGGQRQCSGLLSADRRRAEGCQGDRLRSADAVIHQPAGRRGRIQALGALRDDGLGE